MSPGEDGLWTITSSDLVSRLNEVPADEENFRIRNILRQILLADE